MPNKAKVELPDDITKQLKVISNEIKLLKNGAKQPLEERLHEMGANVREFMDSTKATASEKVELAQEVIKKNPIRNTALAFGAGAVIAALISKRK